MQGKRMFVTKMQKRRLLFPLTALLVFSFQCGTRFAPKPYYAGMEKQVSYNEEIVENMKREIPVYQ